MKLVQPGKLIASKKAQHSNSVFLGWPPPLNKLQIGTLMREKI
jgi:hypothetical protein